MQCEGPDAQVEIMCPLVIAFPVNLWKSDILEQWGATIQSQDRIHSPDSKKMMKKMGYQPRLGLRKQGQGCSLLLYSLQEILKDKDWAIRLLGSGH